MIRLNVFIRTTATNREETVATAKELVAASLKDAGCVAYDLFESATRPDVLMICETWSDAKALAAHETTSHFTTPRSASQRTGRTETRKVRLLTARHPNNRPAANRHEKASDNGGFFDFDYLRHRVP